MFASLEWARKTSNSNGALSVRTGGTGLSRGVAAIAPSKAMSSSAIHSVVLRIGPPGLVRAASEAISLSERACDRRFGFALGEIQMGYRVAVVGATGNVGREILNILAERQFPADEIAAVASARSTGDVVDFGESGETLKVKNLDHFDFEGWDMALFAAGSETSKVHVPRAAAAGCTVIDNSSLFRMDPDVPLIVPEVNAPAIAGYVKKNIIANPNCSTAQLVVALKPLHDAAKIKRVVVSTYQSVSGAGKAGMDELFEQSRNIFVGQANEPVKFPKQIAFNVIPHAGEFLDDGSTSEEWKMVVETKKILDPRIKVTATCVRVPVFVGHSEAVNLEFEREISAEEDRKSVV